jgi:hypothetical protein
LLNPTLVGVEMLQSVRAFLIGSPGNIKNKFHTYLSESANKNKIRWMQELLHKSLLI